MLPKIAVYDVGRAKIALNQRSGMATTTNLINKQVRMLRVLINSDESKGAAEAMRLTYISTEIPIMMGLCAYIGYLMGKSGGLNFEVIGIVVGGLFGFILGTVGLHVMTGSISREKRKNVKNTPDKIVVRRDVV